MSCGECMLQRERGTSVNIRWVEACCHGLSGAVTRGFHFGLGWAFRAAGGFCLLDHIACPRGQRMLCAELPPWTSVFLNATNAKRIDAMYKHVKCAHIFEGIAMNDFACTHCSCDCDNHALLYCFRPGTLGIGCSAINSTGAEGLWMIITY